MVYRAEAWSVKKAHVKNWMSHKYEGYDGCAEL